MANRQEVPSVYYNAFRDQRHYPFPKRTLREKIRRVSEATPSQIAVFDQTRNYLQTYEQILKNWATALLLEKGDHILKRRKDSIVRFPVSINGNIESSILIQSTPNLQFRVIEIDNGVFVFNESGQIVKIILMEQPRTLARDSYITIANPREMAVFDGDQNKKYPVRPDGLCFYGNRKNDLPTYDPQQFVRAVDTFTKEALSPILNP